MCLASLFRTETVSVSPRETEDRSSAGRLVAFDHMGMTALGHDISRQVDRAIGRHRDYDEGTGVPPVGRAPNRLRRCRT